MPRGGVVGLRLPKLVLGTVALEHDDLVVLATDGVAPTWSESPMLKAPAAPQRLAELLVQQHGLPSDDASVMVARYRGGGQ